MADGTPLPVRGSTVLCTGREDAPHAELPLSLPPGETVVCPVCGRSFRRAERWQVLSEAVWPKPR